MQNDVKLHIFQLGGLKIKRLSLFISEIRFLAKFGFLPKRCWVLSDGWHVPHVFRKMPRVNWDDSMAEENIEEGFPLWFRFTKPGRRRKFPEHRVLLRVRGQIVEVVK